MSGRRLADALVQGPGVSSRQKRRLNRTIASIASIASIDSRFRVVVDLDQNIIQTTACLHPCNARLPRSTGNPLISSSLLREGDRSSASLITLASLICLTFVKPQHPVGNARQEHLPPHRPRLRGLRQDGYRHVAQRGRCSPCFARAARLRSSLFDGRSRREAEQLLGDAYPR